MNTLRKSLATIIYYLFLSSIYLIGVIAIYISNKYGINSWVIGIVYYYLISIIFGLVIFGQKRHPSAKLSWLFIFIILPIFGHILYLIFGRRYKYRKSIFKYRQKEEFKNEIMENDIKLENKYLTSLFQQQSKIANRGIYRGKYQFFFYQDEGFDKLFEDIQDAKHSIHIQYYIIKPGELFEQFKNILLKKVKQGIKVRFIIDDFGQWGMPTYKIKQLERLGVEIKKLNPINFPFINSNNGYRTHRKFVVIDGKIAHTGGTNIADEYVNINKKYGWWIDYHTRITGEAVRSYSLLFSQDWAMISKDKIENIDSYLNEDKSLGNSYGVLIEETPENNDKALLYSYVKWILSARDEIKISTPYFVPDPTIIQALKTAALGGVKIKIFIPGRPDKKTVFMASRYYADELRKYGIIFYESKNILIHSKMAIFDNKYAYFGTANLDFRSIHSQFEIANLIVGEDVKQIRDIFEKYKEISEKIEFSDKNMKYIKRLWVHIFVKIFSPMM